MNKYAFPRICFSFLFFISISLSAEPLTFGVVPQQSSQVLAQRWLPVMSYLSNKTMLDIRFTTAKDIPTFEQRVATGEYDIAYMNPYHFTVFNQTPGYEALAKEQGKRIKGIIVVPKDSPLKNLDDLDGTRVAFPSPAAFAASIIPRAKMDIEGIDITPEYVSSHGSVYRSVAQGFFPAGGGIMRTFNNAPAEIREKLRILWVSSGYTPHAIAVHPNVSADKRLKIQQALIAMAADPEGEALLAGLKMRAFEEAKDSDWDDVRDLNIKLLDKFAH